MKPTPVTVENELIPNSIPLYSLQCLFIQSNSTDYNKLNQLAVKKKGIDFAENWHGLTERF